MPACRSMRVLRSIHGWSVTRAYGPTGPWFARRGSGGICVPRSFEVVRLDAPPEIRWVHLRDVLGSGLLDLVATSQLGNSVVVVRSRRDRALETTQIVETGRVGPGLAFGDVDRDGAMDFAVSVQGGSVGVSLAFFDGVAGGLFEAGPVIDQDQNPNWLALLDVNRDGRLDVAVRLAERGCVAFRPNTGPYTFGAAECVIPYSTSTEPEQLLSIDDDHDGRDELFELRYLPDRREIWRHQIGDGTVTASALVDAPLDLLTHNLAIRDVDRDGEVDLLAAELTDVWRVAVRTPMAGGVEGVVFPTIDFADELSIFQMSDLGDVDGDGVLDVVGFSDGGGRSRLYVLYGVP